MQITPCELLRVKDTPYAELKLANESLQACALIDAILVCAILINCPIVKTKNETKLCRPLELVLQLLENPNMGVFTKEDGKLVNISAN